MNIQQTLHKETLKDSDGSTTFYVYMDGDGTRHHFSRRPANGRINRVWE